MNHSRILAILGLAVFAIMTRLVPHPPNFTAINAVAVFCAFTLGHFGLACCVVYGAMFITDLIFGIHSQMLFVYVSLGLTLCLNRFRINSLIALPFSALIFFFVVNFGVWLIDGFYPPTFYGLGLCYVAALPFLMNQIISTCLYGFVLFKGFDLLERHVTGIQESY
jgi:hypothetical protein